jgi:hypothetical protein
MVRAVPIALIIMGLSACVAEKERPRDAIRPTYDKTTGRLTQLTYDSDKNGRADVWTDMDGARPLGARIDRNEDGKIDRWERYDERGGLAKVGFSRSDNGTADAWAFPGADNTVQRIEISSVGDEQRIDRWEYYDPARSGSNGQTALIRAEEDTNADGKPDKWETYANGLVKTVAFDEDGDGVPDRRLTYQGSALALIESQPDASGRFTRRAEFRARPASP